MRVAGVVLGAGLGSRMRPLTDGLPKPLLPLCGRPLLAHLTGRLLAAGAEELFVNLHHQAERMRDCIGGLGLPVPVHTMVETTLTGPAGALRVFAAELKRYDVVLVSSADVITDDDLGGLVRAHHDGRARLTFAVTSVRGARRFGVLTLDGDRVRGAREKPDVPDAEEHWISAGVYCLDPELVDRIPADRVYDYARDLAPAMLAEGEPVAAYRLGGYWRDVGIPEALRDAHLDAVAGRIGWLTADGHDTGHTDATGGVWVAAGAVIGAGAVLRGPAYVGPGAVIGDGAWVERAVVLPQARVEPGGVVIGGLVGHTPLQNGRTTCAS